MLLRMSCLLLGVGLTMLALEASANSNEPTPAQEQGIAAFYRECLQVVGIPDVEITSSFVGATSLPVGLFGGKVSMKTIESREPDTIAFDPVDGGVYLYCRANWADEPGAKALKLEDAISEECAWNRALPLLKHYGLPTIRRNYDIRLQDNRLSEGIKNDLYGVTWRIFGILSYEGVPCRPASTLINVSAQTGEIATVFHYRMPRPSEAHWLVSNVEAVKRVKTWLQKQEHLKKLDIVLDESNLEGVRKVIAQPNVWNPPSEERTIAGIHDKAYYCWEVPFRAISAKTESPFVTKREYLYCAWVHAGTGDVIGGWEPYYRLGE